MTQNVKDVIIFLNGFLEQLSELKKVQHSTECILLAPPFWMGISNYLTNKYTLGKVEFEGETRSTLIHSALTGERPRMDRDVCSETGSHQRASSLHSRHSLLPPNVNSPLSGSVFFFYKMPNKTKQKLFRYDTWFGTSTNTTNHSVSCTFLKTNVYGCFKERFVKSGRGNLK